MRMPRVHIVKSVAEVKREEGLANPRDQPTKSDRPNLSVSQENGLDEDGTHRERDDLRLEITYWWSGLKDHLIKLVSEEILLIGVLVSIPALIGRSSGWRRLSCQD